MKKIAIIAILGLLSFACNKSDSHADHSADRMHDEMGDMHMDTTGSMSDDESLVYYTCPMPEHSAVHHDGPGKCEQCGMDLVPAVITSAEKADFYGCPMAAHSHIRHDESGKCEECGMKLMPMRIAR